jgi:hypothetical protein
MHTLFPVCCYIQKLLYIAHQKNTLRLPSNQITREETDKIGEMKGFYVPVQDKILVQAKIGYTIRYAVHLHLCQVD